MNSFIHCWLLRFQHVHFVFHRFYKGVIKSFDSTKKKHKVMLLLPILGLMPPYFFFIIS